MRITQEADYAIRTVLFLSINENEKVEARTISEKENIPLRFSLKILRKLMQGGLVKSFRGVNGGYSINKNPKDITLKDVIEIVDGPVYINRCLYDKESCNLSRANYCNVHHALEKIQTKLINELEAVTFEDLIKERG